MRKVVLSGIEYSIKYSIRQFFVFEGLAQKRYEGKTLSEDYLLFYSNLIANNKEFTLGLDAFIEALKLDESPYTIFSEFLMQWSRVNAQFQNADNDQEKEIEDNGDGVTELYAVIVGKGGISPSYFLDRMTWYEVDACLDAIDYRERTGWEQIRMLGYITAQAHSTKALKYSDIIRFDWDKKEKANVQVDLSEATALKERVKKRENELNKR